MQEENTIDKATIEAAAEDLYNRYCEATDWKNFLGHPLPKWKEFASDDLKMVQANAWRKVGEYFVCVCTNANALSNKAFNEMFNN